MKINVLTLFPGMFAPVVSESILGKANEKGILDLSVLDIRKYTLDKHKKTDDYPFGGGAGMVMSADPIFRAIEENGFQDKKVFYMSPRGPVLSQEKIEEIAELEEFTILCGHYEGVDERVISHFEMEEISVGDYILTGGELPAMILIDAVARLVPDVLGSKASVKEESIYSGLLEYPQYTKPRAYRGYEVPEVLLSGNHKNIHLWKFEKSLLLTKKRRPDLFQAFLLNHGDLTKDEQKVLKRVAESNHE